MKNRNIKNMIFKIMKDDKILPTPLSIRDFTKATISVVEEDQVMEKIEEKSEETAMGFSKEIKEMSNDKILFLSFLFVSSRFSVDLVKEVYEKLKKELNLTDTWEIDRIVSWFKDDKVNVGEYIEFSHPSYSEALKYLLIEDGYVTWINKEIFSKLLFELAKRDEAAGDVAWTIAQNFDELPENVRDLLLTISEKEKFAKILGWNMVHNFNILSENVRSLLFRLIENYEVAETVAWTISYNFNRLPGNVRNLLFLLLEKDKAIRAVAKAVEDNLDKLPEDVRKKLLFKLPSNVLNEILLRAAAKDLTVELVAEFVTQNFDKENNRKNRKYRYRRNCVY